MEDNNIIKLMMQIEKEFISACRDSEKFVDGNSSAGTRVRKCMQNIKRLAQDVRVEIQEQKNTVTV